MEKKITKKDRFNQLLAIAEVSANEELVAFINHEIELLNKKSAKSGNDKKQTENKAIKTQLFDALAQVGKPITITDLMKSNEYARGLSNQKISAMFKQMIDEGTVEKTSEKGKSLFNAVI